MLNTSEVRDVTKAHNSAWKFTTIRKAVLSEFSIREEKASAQGRVVSLPL
jgi:hypothetical protein